MVSLGLDFLRDLLLVGVLSHVDRIKTCSDVLQFIYLFFNRLWLEQCFAAILLSSNNIAGELTPEIGGSFRSFAWGVPHSRRSFCSSPIEVVPIGRK